MNSVHYVPYFLRLVGGVFVESDSDGLSLGRDHGFGTSPTITLFITSFWNFDLMLLQRRVLSLRCARFECMDRSII